jgi:hypothetical protein
MMENLTNHYIFHGLRVAISGDPLVLEALRSRFRQFPMDVHGPADLTFEFCCVPDEAHHAIEKPLRGTRPIYELPRGEVLYLAAADQLYIDYKDRVRVLCNPEHGYVRLSILQPQPSDLQLVSHILFTIPFIELLKRRKRYSLHAAGLTINEKGLLLAGTSGAGKSTLAIALLRAGFGFLGDDMLFLASCGKGLQVLAFPDEIDVTDETVHLFPELNSLFRQPLPRGWHKRPIWAETLYKVNLVWECKPSVIIFPRVARSEKSILKPMNRDDALLELLPNVLLTQAHSSQAHLDVLAKLVRECECYRLETGHDFDALPLLLRDLMQ